MRRCSRSMISSTSASSRRRTVMSMPVPMIALTFPSLVVSTVFAHAISRRSPVFVNQWFSYRFGWCAVRNSSNTPRTPAASSGGSNIQTA